MRGVLFITTDQYLLGDVSSIGLGPGGGGGGGGGERESPFICKTAINLH